MTVWLVSSNFDNEGEYVLAVHAHYDGALREAREVLMESFDLQPDEVFVRPVTNTVTYVESGDSCVIVSERVLKNESGWPFRSLGESDG